MKLKIFLTIVICTCTALPLIDATPGEQNESKGITENKGYYGYTFIAMVDTNLEKYTKEMEELIRKSQLKKSYNAFPASSYNMSILSIFHYGNELIPVLERWKDEISDRAQLFDLAFQEETNEAVCVLKKYMKESLTIQYATLKFGKEMISLSLDVEEKYMQRIRNARKRLSKVYENLSMSSPPAYEKLEIILANGKRKKIKYKRHE